MKKAIFFSFLILVLFIGLQAEETKYVAGGAARQLALGGSPTNPYVKDYTDVFVNPAYAVIYSDFVFTDLGYSFGNNGYNAAGQTFGFTYAFWKGLSVGLSVGRQEGPLFAQNSYGSSFWSTVQSADNFLDGVNSFLGGSSPIPGMASSASLRPLQVYAAMKIIGLTVGASFYRVGYSSTGDYLANSSDSVTTTTESSYGQTGIKLGVLLNLDVLLLDASVFLRINSATGKYTPYTPPNTLSRNVEINATGTEFGVNSRLFMKFSDKFSLIPMVRFYTFGYEPELSFSVTSGKKLTKPNKFSRTDFEAGVGTQITIPGGHVYTGVSFEIISLKNEDSYLTIGSGYVGPDSAQIKTDIYTGRVTSLPKVNLGAEFEITSWLTGRLGYFKAFSSLTKKTEPAVGKGSEYSQTFDLAFCPTYGTTSADQLLSLGLGIHFDRISIDGYLAEKWLANGPYIASGQSQQMFCVLSMSYSFN